MRRDARRSLIAYDVPDDKRRSRIAKVLEAYGHRMQYSVFIVELGPVKLARLRREIVDLMKAEDSVLLCDLGLVGSAEDRCEFLGSASDVELRSDFIV